MAIVLAPFVRFYLKDYGRFADVQSKTSSDRENDQVKASRPIFFMAVQA